jgi:hypothetical protein
MNAFGMQNAQPLNSLMNVTVVSPDLNMLKPEQCKNLVKKLCNTAVQQYLEITYQTFLGHSKRLINTYHAAKGLDCVFPISLT